MTPPTLNVRSDYFRHPKTELLVELLGPGAQVLPISLWALCCEFHCRDGRMVGRSDEQIELKAGWWGDKGKALSALAKAGFIAKKNGVWGVVNWRKHQGHIYALKMKGRRMAEARWSQYRQGKSRGPGGDADSIAKGMHKQCSDPTDLPTDPTYQPQGSGGGGGRRSGKTSGGAAHRADLRPDNGAFPLPAFTELPRPLFAEKAKAMLEDCELTIAEIRKTGKAEQGAKDALGQPLLTLLPEAREAIKAWQRRAGEIRQARAG